MITNQATTTHKLHKQPHQQPQTHIQQLHMDHITQDKTTHIQHHIAIQAHTPPHLPLQAYQLMLENF
jgi:hypothetical protein